MPLSLICVRDASLPQPNELYQADVTHEQQANDTEAKIGNLLDDHSRLAPAHQHASWRRNQTATNRSDHNNCDTVKL
ncbi:hypothetical protein MSIMFB_02691 [Mycobacterium simulans]|uniref:Uncharacterized protein n=1 Tax=Mycobacterium simulans TaxID=627089 RepID=A0A7Z7IM52_9MYCO|nr:hypothetical protein MSIMFB_02691 [Mycobacterium simulans]